MSVGSAFSSSELQGALVTAEVGVWSWELATERVRWSAETERLFGLEPGTFAQTVEALLERIHVEDRPFIVASLEKAVTEKSHSFRMKHRGVRPDGSVFWAEGRGGVVYDANGAVAGMLGTVIDATLAHEAEKQRQASEELYRVLAELASDYVYHADLTKPLLAPDIVAGAFERTTGYTPEAVAERGGWFEIVHPDDRLALMRLRPEIEAGHPAITEYRIQDGHGAIRWLRDRVRPILDPVTHTVVGIYGCVQDITEQKRLEEQLLQAQKLDALAQLAGGVAHDFNNLLLVITLAHAEVTAFSERGEPAAPSDLDDMRVAVQRASELTRSLLAFSRRQPSERQALDLGLLVERALPMLGRATGKGFRVDVVQDKRGVFAWGDPAQLQLILINLAMNARDASPKSGGATLRVSTMSFDPTSPGRPPELPPGDYATVSVSDDGDGMSKETQQRIFEPFFSTKAPGMGTGLGLATAHGFLRQMGGAIRVSSELGAGSTFTLYLPQAELATASARKMVSLASVGGTERVLLVEDEPTVRRLASRTLRDRGYELYEVNSAEEALALPTEEIRRFKLVLSDFRLPGMDGRTLLTTLRERAPEIRTLLMSGFIGEPAEPNESEHAFIGKPFTVDGLARRVRETLDAPVTPAPRA